MITNEWRKSSRSAADGACVEVCSYAGWIGVRHSKHPEWPPLWFTPAEWEAFTAGAKADEFDLAVSGA